MNRNRKIILKVLAIFFSITCIISFNLGIKTIGEYKNRMYYDFKDFGTALEKFSDELFGILILKDYELSNKVLFNKDALKSFERSKRDAANFGSNLSYYDFEDLYARINEVIVNIFNDGIINSSEREFIMTFYEYNKELIENYKDIFGPLYNTNNTNYRRRFERNIDRAFADFCENADSKLNSDKYMNLISYQGDYSDFDYISAENFINDIFSKVVPAQHLKYNNKNEISTDMLVYTTHAEDDEINILEKNPEPQYKVEYDKKTKELRVKLFASIVPPQSFKEEEIDSLADNIIKRFNYNGFLYEREIKFNSDGEFYGIDYSYINKIGDVYDKSQEIKLSVTSYGIVNEFYIVDHDNMDLEFNFIDSEEILQKVCDAEVIDIYKVKNIKGEAEFIVKLSYEEVNYDVIFNGVTGEMKNYSRNGVYPNNKWTF